MPATPSQFRPSYSVNRSSRWGRPGTMDDTRSNVDPSLIWKGQNVPIHFGSGTNNAPRGSGSGALDQPAPGSRADLSSGGSGWRGDYKRMQPSEQDLLRSDLTSGSGAWSSGSSLGSSLSGMFGPGGPAATGLPGPETFGISGNPFDSFKQIHSPGGPAATRLGVIEQNPELSERLRTTLDDNMFGPGGALLYGPETYRLPTLQPTPEPLMGTYPGDPAWDKSLQDNSRIFGISKNPFDEFRQLHELPGGVFPATLPDPFGDVDGGLQGLDPGFRLGPGQNLGSLEQTMPPGYTELDPLLSTGFKENYGDIFQNPAPGQSQNTGGPLDRLDFGDDLANISNPSHSAINYPFSTGQNTGGPLNTLDPIDSFIPEYGDDFQFPGESQNTGSPLDRLDELGTFAPPAQSAINYPVPTGQNAGGPLNSIEDLGTFADPSQSDTNYQFPDTGPKPGYAPGLGRDPLLTPGSGKISIDDFTPFHNMPQPNLGDIGIDVPELLPSTSGGWGGRTPGTAVPRGVLEDVESIRSTTPIVPSPVVDDGSTDALNYSGFLEKLLGDQRFLSAIGGGNPWDDPNNPFQDAFGNINARLDQLLLPPEPSDSDFFKNVQKARDQFGISTDGDGSGTGADSSFDFDQHADDALISGDPSLEMPEIFDYTETLQNPLYNSILNAVESGVNPYDTRRDAIVKGQMSRVDEYYDDQMDQIRHEFGSTMREGSPLYRDRLKSLTDDRARAKLDIESQFGLEAARSDEPLRRNRLADLSGALTGERQRVSNEMDRQHQYQQDATRQYLDYINNVQQLQGQPDTFMDEGLRLMLGGMGTALNPDQRAAMGGFSSAGENANASMANTNQMIADIIAGF